LKKQRRNKQLLKNVLEDCSFQFRKIIDSDGDIGDALVFFLDTRDQTDCFVKKMRAAGLGGKIFLMPSDGISLNIGSTFS
jgi:hypothetical protein